MCEGLSTQEVAWYQALRRLVQNHARTHQLNAWNLYMALLALLAVECQVWCDHGMPPRRLLAEIAPALRHALTLAPPEPPLLPAPVALAQTVQPPRMQATTGLTQACATLLGDAGRDQGLRIDQACGLSVRLVGEVLGMFLVEQPRAEVEGLIASTILPMLAQALGMAGAA